MYTKIEKCIEIDSRYGMASQRGVTGGCFFGCKDVCQKQFFYYYFTLVNPDNPLRLVLTILEVLNMFAVLGICPEYF